MTLETSSSPLNPENSKGWEFYRDKLNLEELCPDSVHDTLIKSGRAYIKEKRGPGGDLESFQVVLKRDNRVIYFVDLKESMRTESEIKHGKLTSKGSILDWPFS